MIRGLNNILKVLLKMEILDDDNVQPPSKLFYNQTNHFKLF